MAKSFLYRFFGAGKISPLILEEFSTSDLLFKEEGLSATVTYRDFRCKGRYSNWRRQWVTVSLLLTSEQLILFCYSKKIIDIELSDERILSLNISQLDSGRLQISFDASLFNPECSGTIEYIINSDETDKFIDSFMDNRL